MRRLCWLLLLAMACGDPPIEPPPTDGSALLQFSHPGGLFSDPFALTITATQPGTIRYSVDGSRPTAQSPRYTGTVDIEDTVQVRAGLFDTGDGSVPMASESYLFAESQVLSFTSELPVLIIETFGDDAIDDDERPRSYRPVYLLMLDETGALDTRSRAGMHVRGNSSLDYDKRQYRIELWDELDDDRNLSVLGLPREADWVLHAPYSDKSLMRNHLMYSWSNRIDRYAPRTRLIEAFIDRDGDGISMDDYEGVFLWAEKIQRDSDRVAIAKMEPTDVAEPEVTGGYLLVRDWDRGESPGIETAEYEDFLQIEYPKADRLVEAQEEWLRQYLDDFESALAGPAFADPATGYAGYIDVDSFIDFHLLNELARNVDAFVLSTFMHKDRSGPLTMGPIWDFNGSLGNADYFEAWDPMGWHHQNPEFPADNPNGYRWYQRLFEDPAFQDRYAARWRQLRTGALATATLLDDIASTAQLLESAAERNFERWPILGEYVWPNDEGHAVRVTYAQEVDYLQSWLLARLDWMDLQLAGP